MELKLFSNQTIFIDTAPLIYYIEENPIYLKPLRHLFLAYEEYGYLFMSSVITLIEVLVLPLRYKKNELAQRYETILTNSKAIKLIAIDDEIAKIAARLRAEYSLKTPDAIQLATAIAYSADTFLTNDKRLKTIKEINVITLDELVI
ncbi:MAG: PIN domain-containing protein [Prevotellaceae bacterium]|jgi:predicted nucleic acid-binding protein|nr:PIN domain-containing protein [Prevotellaceae bacterium]